MTAPVWEPMLNSKRAIENHERNKQWFEWVKQGKHWKPNAIVLLDNGVLFDLDGIMRITEWGDWRGDRSNKNEVSRTTLTRIMGMGLREFRLFCEDRHNDFPKPSRVVKRSAIYYSNHTYRPQTQLFWDIEEVLQWADNHQVK